MSSQVERWLEVVWEAGGTDLHIAAGRAPSARVDGRLEPIEGEAVLDEDAATATILGFLEAHGADLGEADDVDFGLTFRDEVRVRGNAYRERSSIALALRLIPLRIPTLAELGLPPVVEKLASWPSGLVVVTGPTGSGKSTTLASMIDAINRTRPCHVLTIEDPVEYVHAHDKALISQRQIGTDVATFDAALRAALREDPDVVLVGEMRDADSIQAALTIAETGHLVLTTLHTNDTAQAVDRIVDVFPAERRAQVQVQLAATLQGVIYQQLLPKVGGGMVVATEVMVATHAVRNLVREGKSRQLRNVVATGQADGMRTLEHDLSELVSAGTVSHEAAVAVSLHPAEITKKAPTTT